MKKILLVFLAVALVFSCQKKEVAPVQIQQDVVFDLAQIDPGSGLKSGQDNWVCPTDNDGNLLEPDSAEIDITFPDQSVHTFKPAVFNLDGKLYTQAIKLPASDQGTVTYTITKFLLKHDGEIIMATPETDAKYAEYVTQGVDFTFQVTAFTKAEVPVDVLCFLPELYANFGFKWFNVTQIVVREQCFFGDICVDGDTWVPADFEGSLYDEDQLPDGIQVDMPAIMKIVVYKDGVEVENSPFTNATSDMGYGVGHPLCVEYPDNLEIDGEVFTFELYVWLPDYNGDFSYQLLYTYTAVDDGDLDVPDVGGDGINEFVIGDCVYSTTDLQLYPPDQTPPGSGCETAYANGGSYATCFLLMDEIHTNRWGWTNGALSDDATYSFDIYAAAGQCDVTKGTNVGTLTVDYSNGEVNVTYSLDSPYTLDEVHLYVGNDILPKKNGHYTVAPGQYPYQAENLGGVSTYSFNHISMTGDIYVVAHAVVCGL